MRALLFWGAGRALMLTLRFLNLLQEVTEC
jgi:hypothetical protein